MAKKDTKAVEVASAEPTITVDGEQFTISALSPQIQNAIGLLNQWNAQKTEAEQKVVQLQYAVNALSVELAKAIKPAAEEAAAPAAE
jgi:hypothetical protein